MTQSNVRIVLAILLFPVAEFLPGLIEMYNMYNGSGWPPSIQRALVGPVLTNVIMVSYWIVLWRRQVHWTNSRIRWTCLIGVASLAIGTSLVGLFVTFAQDDVAIGIMTFGNVPPYTWILGTAFVWRETRQERLERLKGFGTAPISCPVCEYSMTGLQDSRCPECGTRFTLDELFSAQHDREEELEQA